MSSSPSSSEDDASASDLNTAADRLLEVAEHGASVNDLDPKWSSPSLERLANSRSLEERLLELHIEESNKAASSIPNPNGQHHLNPCSSLVSLLCLRDRLNRLLVTLSPEEYSVHVVIASLNNSIQNGAPPAPPAQGSSANANAPSAKIELFTLPYEEEDFLSYIDNEELPVAILDLLDKSWSELFYSGCVIAEVRDQRRQAAGGGGGVQTSHVLLRPTTQSLICDSKLICERMGWTSREERAMVESQLCLATEPHLCLDPDPVVSILARKSTVGRSKFATASMRRHAKRFSQVS